MRTANLFVHDMSSFRGGFRNIILGVIRKWTSKAELNFEFYLGDWHFRHIPFTAVLISNTASEGDETPLFYRVEKNLGRPRPLKMVLRKSYIRAVMISVNLFSTYRAAVIWQKYCRYDVKHYKINQSTNQWTYWVWPRALPPWFVALNSQWYTCYPADKTSSCDRTGS